MRSRDVVGSQDYTATRKACGRTSITCKNAMSPFNERLDCSLHTKLVSASVYGTSEQPELEPHDDFDEPATLKPASWSGIVAAVNSRVTVPVGNDDEYTIAPFMWACTTSFSKL